MDNLESLKPEDPMAISMRYNYVPANVFYGKKEEKQVESNVENNDQGAQETTNGELKDESTQKEVAAANLIANTVSYKIFASLEGDLIPKNLDIDNNTNPEVDQD